MLVSVFTVIDIYLFYCLIRLNALYACAFFFTAGFFNMIASQEMEIRWKEIYEGRWDIEGLFRRSFCMRFVLFKLIIHAFFYFCFVNQASLIRQYLTHKKIKS